MASLPPLVVLDVSHISLVLIVLGAYVCCIGQLSYLIKEKAFMSSAMIALIVGIAFGPIGAGWIKPNQWTGGDLNPLTFQICRLVIGIQVLFAGISLPAAYLKRRMKDLTVLLLPIMACAWLVSSALIMALLPNLSWIEALCISAAITPTDPILANSIVKGRFAEKHVPKPVRDLIAAESGANDGLGYPFLFLPIYIMERGSAGIGGGIKEWIISTWLYQIGVSCVLGALLGFVARVTLKQAHKRQMIDHESFLAYGIGLALLTLGVVGVLGADDILACFICGNSLTWQDFYRIENEDEAFQDVIDDLLNTATFIYIGAIMPWSSFGDATLGLSAWRLVIMAVLILLLRRPPWLMAMRCFIPSLDGWKEAAFAGWFGPIGVSAIYYAILAVEHLPVERQHLRETIYSVVLFMALASTIAHGVTIPLARFGPLLYRQTKTSVTSVFDGAATLLGTARLANGADGTPPGSTQARHQLQANTYNTGMNGDRSASDPPLQPRTSIRTGAAMGQSDIGLEHLMNGARTLTVGPKHAGK